MSRKLTAFLVSSALVFGHVSTAAWSAPVASSATSIEAVQSQPVQVAAAANNPSPLPPAGAAGVKQAQGFEITPLVGTLLVVGVVAIIYFLLHEDLDDDDNGPVTTGTS